MTELAYDYQDALNWALAHNMALTVDLKSFEKIARATPIPFVEKHEVAQATTARELP